MGVKCKSIITNLSTWFLRIGILIIFCILFSIIIIYPLWLLAVTMQIVYTYVVVTFFVSILILKIVFIIKKAKSKEYD